MAEAWPEPVERVSAVLREAGAEARVEEFAAGTPTAEDAANAVGCDLSQIVKSLRLRLRRRAGARARPGRPPRRQAPRSPRPSAPRRHASRAPEQVVEATGYPPGGVAPFALARGGAGADRQEPARSTASSGSAPGRRAHMAGLPATELVRVARAQHVDVDRATSKIAEKRSGHAGDREDLDERRARGLGGRPGPRRRARPALRHRRLRGHPLLRHRARPGGLPPRRSTSQRLQNSAKLLYMELPYSVDELRAACIETIGVNGLDRVLPPARSRSTGTASSASTRATNPVDVVIMCWPWGAYLGEEGQQRGDPRDDLVLAPRRPEHDPARREGDRRLPELDARDARGAPRRLRRGDHAERQRLHRRRAGRDDLHGQGRRRSSRPTSPRRSCPGSRATRSSRSPRTSATAWSRSR